MCRCMLCWPVTHNQADYTVTFGNQERVLQVCRWCEQDLALLGFRANQIVHLEASRHVRSIPLSLLVLGPVYSLFTEEIRA